MIPKVSVIISAYNAEKYLYDTLNSVFNQTWKNLEIILVNDGSTDRTRIIAEKYLSQNLILINQINSGQNAALNAGFRISSGDFIKFLDSDDLINPEMIELQVNTISNYENYVAYGEWARFYNNNPASAKFEYYDYWQDMAPLDFLTSDFNVVMLQCGIMLLPRNLIEKVGLWDERLILFNDTEFFTRIILGSNGIKFVPNAKLFYRSGNLTSVSLQKSIRHYTSTLLATDLISGLLLSIENSYRVRKLIGNLYKDQYCDMYPRYPQLLKLYKLRVIQFPEATYTISGGKIFLTIKYIFGWKIAKYIKELIYNFGYRPLKKF